MSRKSQETWEFAHDYCGRLWYKLGIITLIPSIIVQIPFVHASDEAIGICTAVLEGVQVVILVGSLIPVEIALRKNFDKYGKRKEL